LNSIGFNWRAKGYSEEEWHMNLQKLKAFKNEYRLTGDTSTACEDKKFCAWFRYQLDMVNKFNCDEEKSPIIQKKVVKLVLDMGILDTEVEDDEVWNMKLKNVIIYCNENKACPRARTGNSLYNFLHSQQQRLFGNGEKTLNQDVRKKKLLLFGFDLAQPISQCRNNDNILELADDKSLDSISLHDKPTDSNADFATSHDMPTNSTSPDEMNEEGKEQQRKLNKKSCFLKIPRKKDRESIWICDECYQRYEKEEDALNCMC